MEIIAVVSGLLCLYMISRGVVRHIDLMESINNNMTICAGQLVKLNADTDPVTPMVLNTKTGEKVDLPTFIKRFNENAEKDCPCPKHSRERESADYSRPPIS